MLEIRKITNKVWKHVNNIDGEFILSKFYIKNEFSKFLIVEVYGSKRREYTISEIEVYDIGGSAETFANFTLLFQRLEELNYPAFYEDGMILASSLISTDVGNNITTGTDGLLYSAGGGGAKRVAICDLGKFKIQVTAVNNYVRHTNFGYYYYPSLATGISDHSLLVPSHLSVIYKVPFDCSLEEICLTMSTTFDGSFSIWKTAPNSVDSTPIELYHVDDNSTNISFKQFVINSDLILKDSYIHIFYARRTNTQAWFSAGFLRFKEL